LNVTPNSFSDGGKYDSPEKACEHFSKLVHDGADVIDIGAESTKPHALPVEPEEQLRKIMPVLDFARSKQYNVPISIDTRSSIVAEECLKNGASIINDVSGLKYDDKMAEVISENNATLILQHSSGNAVNMEGSCQYTNVVEDVFLDLHKQVEHAKSCGITSIIVDAGIGFDKSREDNFKLLDRIEELYSFGYPVMTGISRKSLLNMQDKSNQEKDIYTLALNAIAIDRHIDYIRVHNVKIHKDFIEMIKY
jgi:dihydropteroate synthase